MGFSFVFLAPYAVDRSLSTFIFFYAVENGSFPENSVSLDYMNKFYTRRLNDGLLGNFLEKREEFYYPTWRTKLYYFIMHPIGLATNSTYNYQMFVKEVHKNTGTIDD